MPIFDPHASAAEATKTSPSSRRVRTRFAPSPTGMLHLGALRTALFSWLLARNGGGDFILRIEDTDQSRLEKNSLENIVLSLRQMGMDYDEGPDKASVAALDASKYGKVRADLLPDNGGAFGPYFQSQRLPRYRQLLDELLDNGNAYYAFESKEELDGMKAAANARKLPYLYDRRYRDTPLDEARARVAAGAEHVIRFKMPIEGPIRTTDALRGVTVWDAATQDDFIILKGDGFPPYHFAAIVDDHDMDISHVLRGEDWLPSFPKHACLIQAFGWEPPVFVHTPNVLAPGGGKKLSKRHGAKGVGEFLDEGFLRDALVNFLALVGWSPGNDDEILPADELIARFSVAGISPSPAAFDIAKLDWMNGMYIRQLSGEEFARRAVPFLQKTVYGETAMGEKTETPPVLPDDAPPDVLEYAARVVALEQERVKRLDEVGALTNYFFPLLPDYQEKSVQKWLRKPGTALYLSDLRDVCADETTVYTHDALEAATREVGTKHGREKGDLTHPVRVAVSGREVGPGLFEMMAVLGRERVVARLTEAMRLAETTKTNESNEAVA